MTARTASLETMIRLARPLTDLAADYDVVIIGSGYGGAVCASRLARANMRVCVLERGREVLPGEFPQGPADFARAAQVEHSAGRIGDRSALFRFVFDDECGSVSACGVGGTSLLNAGVSIRPNE